MRLLIKSAAATVLTLAASLTHATVTDDLVALRASRNDPVTPGVWHADLVKARAYAEDNGLPLIAVWSNGDFCQHCLVWEGVATSPLFKEWMKTSGIVFYFGYVKDGYLNAEGDFGGGPSSDGQEGYHGTSFYWCCNYQSSTMAWPYVRFYWPKGGIDVAITGSATDGEYAVKGGLPCMVKDSVLTASEASAALYAPWVQLGDFGTYNPGARFWLNYIANQDTGLLRNWKGAAAEPPVYGEFAESVQSAKDKPAACLQLEYGTSVKSLVVPLTRSEATETTGMATNMLICNFPGRVTTNRVLWSKGQTVKNFTIPIDASWFGDDTTVTNYVTMMLKTEKYTKAKTTYAAIIPPMQNSPKNPCFIGERDTDTLQYGEWTMDLDTVLEKARNTEGANVLALVGGSLWCKDCAMAERYIFDTDTFRDWARDNKVLLVAIDIPSVSKNDPTGVNSACLLSSVLRNASVDYVNNTGKGEGERYQCGLAYRSRHGIAPTAAASALTKNLELAGGKFNKLVVTNPSRPGVPTAYVLRPSDGSIAGRIYQLSKSTASLGNTSAAAFTRRADEMFEQVGDANEERNDSYTTTSAAIGGRSVINNTLSFSDQVDTYKINAPSGTEIVFTLSSDTVTAPAILSVIDGASANPEQAPVAIVTNDLSATGFSVAATLPSSSCFVKVAYPTDKNGFPTDAYLAFTKTSSTVCPYTLSSDSVIVAGETFQPMTIEDGNPEVIISLEEGQLYRFSGLDGNDVGNAAALDYDETTGLYTSKQSGAVRLVLDDDGPELVFGFQKWVPGTFGFELASKTVKERGLDEYVDWKYTFYARRTGGVSGVAKARVVLDEMASTALDDGTIYEWDPAAALVWGEGTNGLMGVDITIKGNRTADGLQKIVFSLLPDDDSSATTNSATVFTLWIDDDDPTTPGVMSLVSVNGNDIPASRTIVAKGGSSISLGVIRQNGTDGALAGELRMAGEKAGEVEWEGRTGDLKSVIIPVPSYAEGSNNKVLISLNGVSGAKVDADGKYLTVNIVPDDAAGFTSPAETLSVTRYVATPAPLEVGVDAGEAGEVSVDVLSGSLAPGMSGTYDAESRKLLITGVPTKAGAYIATYQVTADGVKGATVQVKIDVADPTVEGADGSEAENPSVATTRTINDILVLNAAEERLAGLLTLTIPPSGRLSAKYRPVAGSSVALMCTNWSAYEDKAYKATLTGETDDEVDCALDVTAKSDGSVEVLFRIGEATLPCVVPKGRWSSESSAAAWRGYYTVSLPFKESTDPVTALATGDAFATLRMTSDAAVNAGRMSYAGVLPNGRAFSGSAVVAQQGDAVLLPILCISSSDVLSGVLSVNPSADYYRSVYPYTDVYPYWEHVESGISTNAVDYGQKLDAFGCLYDPDADLVGCCVSTFQTHMLAFFALPEKMPAAIDGLAHGDADAWSTNNTAIKVFKSNGTCRMRPPDVAAAKEAPEALTYSFDRLNGLVSGTFNLFFDGEPVPVTFRGVVLPGWGSASCTSCSDGSSEAIKRPFVSGPCWFDDRYEYEALGGRVRKLSVRRGCPISVGLEPGM